MSRPRRVHGVGPIPCAIMIVGEGPGWQEDRAGQPFVGKTGDELNRFLGQHGIPARKDIYLTNLHREYRGKDYIYTTEDVRIDEQDLIRELHQVQPSLIVPLGRAATRWFLGDVDMDSTQGIAWELNICYACAKHGRKVLATSAQDERLLALDGAYTKSRVRLANVPLQELASAPAGIHVREGANSEWISTRPSMQHSSMCQSISSRSSDYRHQQQTREDTACSVSMGTSSYSRKYLLLPEWKSTLSGMRSNIGAATGCPICAGDLWQTVAFPVIHVAASFHNPEMAAYVVSGFTQLAAYLDGKIEPRILFDDPFVGKEHYEEITSSARLRDVMSGWSDSKSLAIDTEGWPERPWSVQFSHTPGKAYLIRATRRDLLASFAQALTEIRPKLVYHSALHDLIMMRVLGLPTDLEFDDTMVMAYVLQLEPQGLKALCSRHAGMKMQSYDEVLGDAGQRLAVDYLSALWNIEQFDWEERCKNAFWQEIDKGRRFKVYPKLPKSSLHKAVERGLRSLNSRNLWKIQVEDIQVAGYKLLGAMPEPTLDHVALPLAIHYGCRDADGTTRICAQLATRIATMDLSGVYRMELFTYPLIERMSYVGIKPDLAHFRHLSARLRQELDHLQAHLVEQTGRSDFNANSGDQVANLLFDSLHLESIKDTKYGRASTNDKILEALEHEHPEYPVISTIRDYRELYKLKNTFVDCLPDFTRRWPYDARIHAAFRTTRVVTGRLAASDPNLLAMPKHGKFAREFRRGWVPEDGHILCEWDLSQIELRVLAHLSQDERLLAAFRDGLDLHAGLAVRIFGGAEMDHKKGTTRLAAKAINFGLPMGMMCKGLSVELRKNGVDADEDDAQKWLDETMALYKQVPVYQERMANEAYTNGYVRCLSGRIRYIGGIRSPHRTVREEARRFAFSTPIQEGAQWIMKQAEARVWQMLLSYWKDKRWVEPLIQIHDSLLLECEDDMNLARDVHRQMREIMTMVPTGFTVPIEISGEWGRNWCGYDEKAKYSPSTPGNGDMVAFEG